LARLAVNFKNTGNGGFFDVFEVPQMENRWKWKMEDGKWSMAGVQRSAAEQYVLQIPKN